MQPIKPAFARAVTPDQCSSLFWMLLWIIVLDDDRKQREKERRKRNTRAQQRVHRPRPPAGPRPF